MNRQLLIIADWDEWRILDHGAFTDTGALDELPHPVEGVERIVIPTAAEIVLARVDFAGLAPAQARAAARMQLAGESLLDSADFHVAVSDDGGWGATASQSAVAGWRAQYRADRIIPPQMLLASAGGPTVAAWGDGFLVSGQQGLAFADQPLLDHILANAEFETLSQDVIEHRLIELAAAPTLDLLQGQFAARPPALFNASQKRLAAWLAVAAGLFALAIPTVQLVRLNASAGIAEETAKSRALAAIGGQGTQEQAITALDAKLTAMRGGGAGFGKTSQAALAAMQQTASVEALSLQFTTDGQMVMQVKAAKAEDIGQLTARMQALGLIVSVGALNPAQSQPVTELRISGL